MASVPFSTVRLAPETVSGLDAVPTAAGVGQILDRDGRSLVIGRPANLRRWVAAHLGRGRPPRAGARPRTDLSPVAATLVYAVTRSPFHQRLLFERAMARVVPQSQRRDLRPPVFLRLDPNERFPRATPSFGAGERDHLFGPFRDRRAAEAALKALRLLFPLRPCPAAFEPDPENPLRQACLYSQLGSCPAPCLGRIGEEAYRDIARRAVAFLTDADRRPDPAAAWLPLWVTAVLGFGLVVESVGDQLDLYPLRDGVVLEGVAVRAPSDELAARVAELSWPLPPTDRSDLPWFSTWLHTPRRSGVYLHVPDPANRPALVDRIRAACFTADP